MHTWLKAAGSLALVASLAGCPNMSIQDLKAMLTQAGIELNVADRSGNKRMLTKADIKEVYVDGQKVAADKWTFENGQVKLLEVPKNAQFKLKVVLMDGTVLDNIGVNTADGKATTNKAVFVPNQAGTGFEQGAEGQTFEDAIKDFASQHEQDLLHRVTISLGMANLNNESLILLAHKKPGMQDMVELPDFAYDTDASGNVRFDVQLLNFFRDPNTHQLDQTALDGTIWTLLSEGGEDSVIATHFKITQTGLQLPDDTTQPPTLPAAQTVGAGGWSQIDTKTYASLEEAIATEHIQPAMAPQP